MGEHLCGEASELARTQHGRARFPRDLDLVEYFAGRGERFDEDGLLVGDFRRGPAAGVYL
jgi:hypothetical protein